MMHLAKTLWLLGSLAHSCFAAETPKYPKSVKLTYTLLGSQTPSKPQPLAEVLYDPTTLKSHLSSWTPPSTSNLQSSSIDEQNSPLVRISLPDGSSSVTTLSAFDPSLSQYIDLWISNTVSTNEADTDSGSIFSASISPISPAPLSDEEAKEQARQKRKEERAKAKGKPIPSPKPKPKTPTKPKKNKKDTSSTATVAEQLDVGPVVKINLLKQDVGPRPKLNSRKPPQVDSEGREVPAEDVQEKSFFQKYWWVFLAITFVLVGSGGGDK